ncbi:MAG TPA: S8 family serine peptidase [Chloroflexia bacterium]|jgi:serine protease AprX
MNKQLHTRSLGIYGSRLGRFLMMLALMLPLLAFSPAQENAPKAHAALLEMAARQPNATVSVIVQEMASSNAESVVARLGGTVTKDLHIINAFAAQMTAKTALELSKSDSVRWVSMDAAMVSTLCTVGCTGVDTSKLRSPYVQAVQAPSVWNSPDYLQGQGIGVAVVDSGITATHADLQNAAGTGSRVVASVSINSTSVTTSDEYGHGTHVAGIIGGNGSASNGNYIGVAPKVNLINVKVSDDTGAVSASDVVSGLQWILNNKDAYNIKVVNLSLNSSIMQDYNVDPLDAAVEILWFNKIVVVVASGNEGRNALYPPANDPFVITVGAVDDMGTADTRDDVVASYSAYGRTIDRVSKPDLVAPGTNMISTLPSDVAVTSREHSDHRVTGFPGARYYFRMSGTSMAAPVVAGAAALLIQDEPYLTPDQVKYRLMATTRRMNGPRAGAGELDVSAAVNGTTLLSANTGIPASQLLWTGSTPITWTSVNWGSVNWGSVNWGSVNWGSVNWGSVNWGSDNWDY